METSSSFPPPQATVALSFSPEFVAAAPVRAVNVGDAQPVNTAVA